MIDMLNHYDAPTVDVYFELKVCQHQYEKREKEMERKRNIERLQTDIETVQTKNVNKIRFSLASDILDTIYVMPDSSTSSKRTKSWSVLN